MEFWTELSQETCEENKSSLDPHLFLLLLYVWIFEHAWCRQNSSTSSSTTIKYNFNHWWQMKLKTGMTTATVASTKKTQYNSFFTHVLSIFPTLHKFKQAHNLLWFHLFSCYHRRFEYFDYNLYFVCLFWLFTTSPFRPTNYIGLDFSQILIPSAFRHFYRNGVQKGTIYSSLVHTH